ncbi:sel1 repeat family protein [Thalassotalea sp. M1531]|uniref:Sel1 repeat family protein n=1 Tax=Thalassotalea algicola TaxID=2716224 RepID=A0A7Y0LCC6_9GAMM|nr:tetratricopeptide repeat protein [Thalassotalea algicola]NMP31974.1 sel1 repeat family protein [Thalassotalea algicola]
MKILLAMIAIAALVISFSSTAIKIEPCDTAECREYYKHFKLNAKRGQADAIATLAEFYYHGYGTPKNIVRAVKHYKKAARLGVVRAQYKAGLIHLINERFHDYDKGIKYLEKAAYNQHMNAMYLLGIIYYSDQFGEHDKAKADKWLARAFRYRHNDMPEFVDHMYSFEDITQENFPMLYAELDEKPLIKSKDNQLIWPEMDGTEVITVRAPDINEILSDQLKSFRRKIRRTGTRIPGIDCNAAVACRKLTVDEMKDSYWIVAGPVPNSN